MVTDMPGSQVCSIPLRFQLALIPERSCRPLLTLVTMYSVQNMLGTEWVPGWDGVREAHTEGQKGKRARFPELDRLNPVKERPEAPR